MMSEDYKSEIEKLNAQANDFLRSHFFYAAKDLYERVLESDPEDETAYLGILMSEALVTSKEDLIAYYQTLYSDKTYETAYACEKDEEHIEEICEKYRLKGYLEEEEIVRSYRYDLSYESLLSCRMRQKELMLAKIDEDGRLSYLKRKDPDFIKDILDAYDQRINDAKESDQISIDHIRQEYRSFLSDSDEKVLNLYQDALRHRKNDLERLIQSFEASEDLDELESISKMLEDFKDLEEGKRAYDECLNKIEEVKRKELSKPDSDQIEKILLFARGSLENKKFSQAYDAYRQLLSYGNESEEIHLGILKAQCQINDTDKLFEYYKNLYNEDHKEVLEAVKSDADHIDEMIEKYSLPGYFERNEIAAAYEFDRTYRSSLKHRINEETRFKQLMEDNPSFKWLDYNGSKPIREQIASVYETYAKRIEDARKEDEKNIDYIRNEYRRFLFQTYSSIRNKYQLAIERKDQDYQKLIRRFDSADDESKLNDLILDLKEFGDYKQVHRYIGLCEEKIERSRKEKEKKTLRRKIDVLLEEGNRALEKGKKEIAEKCFSDVLVLDKNDPYAYLGLLMIETGVHNESQLSDHYKKLYSGYEPEMLEACEEDTAHIKQMVERFCLPGYLEEDKIRSYYKLDRTYECETPCREEQKRQIKEEFEMNPYLSKIMGRKDDHLEGFYEDILKAYDQRIKEAMASDLSRKNSIIDIYRYYMKQSDLSLKELYEQKQKEKEADDQRKYQENVIRFNEAVSDQQFKELITSFDPGYKDSKDYIAECEIRISKNQADEAKESLDALFEKGKELLKDSRYEGAKLSFSSYLKYDPENEDAHLYLAMADSKTKDMDGLFEYLKNLYSDEITIKKKALEPDREHIAEIVRKYQVPLKLERNQILNRYDVELSYDALYETRLKQKEEILKKINEDPSLSWLKANGSEPIRERFADLLYVYEDRIRQAKQEDEDIEAQYKEAYETFLEETDKEVRDLYLDIVSRRNNTETTKIVTKEIPAVPAQVPKAEKEDTAKETIKVKERPEKKSKPKAVQKDRKEKKQNGSRKPLIISMAIVALVALIGGAYYLKNARVINDYGRAMEYADNGDYDEAIALFETLGDYKDSMYLLKEVTYKKADQLYKQGKLEEALTLFSSLRFDDSEDRASQIRKQLSAKAKAGDTLYFGSYEQDGNTENGAELIEWMVLEEQNGKALLISRYGIEARPFHDSATEVYWEGSDLRTWLNNDFMEQAFSSSERSDILQTTLMNSQYDTQDFSEKPAMELSKTRDRVFLLSEEEVESYLPEEDDRICEVSTAVKNSDIKMPEEGCNWWLRSSNMEKDKTIQIVSGENGRIEDSSCELVNVVRPVIWIRTN